MMPSRKQRTREHVLADRGINYLASSCANGRRRHEPRTATAKSIAGPSEPMIIVKRGIKAQRRQIDRPAHERGRNKTTEIPIRDLVSGVWNLQSGIWNSRLSYGFAT